MLLAFGNMGFVEPRPTSTFKYEDSSASTVDQHSYQLMLEQWPRHWERGDGEGDEDKGVDGLTTQQASQVKMILEVHRTMGGTELIRTIVLDLLSNRRRCT